MNIVDIILGILLILAAWQGYKAGILLQLGGIIGIVIGVRIGFKYGWWIGELFGLEDSSAQWTGFIIILIGVLIAIAILGRLGRGLLRVAGLGMFDAVGGAILSVVKGALIISMLFMMFNGIMGTSEWKGAEKFRESVVFEGIDKGSQLIFPYLYELKDKLSE